MKQAKHRTRILEKKADSDHWIQSAIKHPGALHRKLGVPEDKKIPEAKIETAAKKGGKLGEEARMAETLRGLNKKAENRIIAQIKKAEADRETLRDVGLDLYPENQQIAALIVQALGGPAKATDKTPATVDTTVQEKEAGVLLDAIKSAKGAIMSDASKVGDQVKNIIGAAKANGGVFNQGTMSTVKALAQNRAVQAGAGALAGAGAVGYMAGQNKQASAGERKETAVDLKKRESILNNRALKIAGGALLGGIATRYTGIGSLGGALAGGGITAYATRHKDHEKKASVNKFLRQIITK